MNLLENLINAMLQGNAKAMAAYFDTTGRYDDSCLTGVFHAETHLIGRAAVDMHFFNRFIFQTYQVVRAQVIDDSHAELDIMNVGQPEKVVLSLDKCTADGKIAQVTVRAA